MFGLFQTFIIAENERGFLYRNQQFDTLLMPGRHRVYRGRDELVCQRFNLAQMYFTQPMGHKLLVEHAEISAHIHNWVIDTSEVGILYLNDRMHALVAPGERVMIWKAVGDVRLERVSLSGELQLEAKLYNAIKLLGLNKLNRLVVGKLSEAKLPIFEVVVERNQQAMLYIDGNFTRMLGAGTYAFWQLNQDVKCEHYELRSQTMEICGQEILTKDRVSVRLNLSANIRLTDIVTVAGSVEDYEEYVYKTMQLALREAVGTKTLDDLLLDKLYINETVRELVTEDLNNIGIELERVGLKDIILPGDMKTILNQVVEAQKTAEANVIRRREETAATRSLHNTAKLMENNPTLMRLKELEALEKLSERINQLNIYGGIEGLMKGTINLN